MSNTSFEKYKKALECYGAYGEATIRRTIALVILNEWRQMLLQANIEQWDSDRLLQEAEVAIELGDIDLFH